jgi:sulfite exporter TauE/SafE
VRNSGYTILGWVVWQIGSRVAKRKLAENRVKIGAAAAIALVLLGGLLAARGNGD